MKAKFGFIVLMVSLVVLGVSLALAGGSVPTTDLVIGDASGTPGQTGVAVDVVINTQGQVIRGANVNLAFDGLVLPNAVAVRGPAIPDAWTFVENLADPGDHRVIILDISGVGQVLSGVLYTIEFDVAADSLLGDIPLTFSLTDIPDGGTINAEPGVFSVVGDVVSNGVIAMGFQALIDSLDVTPRTFKGVGSVQQFTAIANFTDGTTGNVTSQAIWSTSDPAVAIVSATGLGTIVGPGDAVITATIDPIP